MSRPIFLCIFLLSSPLFGQTKFSYPITFSSEGVRDASRANILAGTKLGDYADLVTTPGGLALLNNAGTANTFPYYSAENEVSLASISANGLALLAAANTGAARTVLSLNNVDNTSDVDKPISTATQTALDGKEVADSDLTLWAGITPGTGVGTFLATPTSANLAAALADKTGTGVAVFSTSPVFVTPTLGVATATTINGITITAGNGTITLGSKNLIVANSMTLAGVDGSTLNIGAGGTLGSLAFLSSVGSAQITDGSVTAVDLASGAARANLTGGSGLLDFSSYTLTLPVTLPASSGVNLTALNASNLGSGTVSINRFPAMTGGDATTSAGSGVITIGANAVTNTKSAQMATMTLKGNNTGATANSLDLTASQALTVVCNAGAGTTLTLTPNGSQANIDVLLAGKGTGSIILNNGQTNTALQVKAATDANLISADLLNGRVAIGAATSATTAKFNVTGTSASQPVASIKAASSQTANLLNLLDASGMDIGHFKADGTLEAVALKTINPANWIADTAIVYVDTSLALPTGNEILAATSTDAAKSIATVSGGIGLGQTYTFLNTSTTRSITFTNSSNIRCRGATDLVVGPEQTCTVVVRASDKISVH